MGGERVLGGLDLLTCELWEKTLATWEPEFLFPAMFSSCSSNEEFGRSQLSHLVS